MNAASLVVPADEQTRVRSSGWRVRRGCLLVYILLNHHPIARLSLPSVVMGRFLPSKARHDGNLSDIFTSSTKTQLPFPSAEFGFICLLSVGHHVKDLLRRLLHPQDWPSYRFNVSRCGLELAEFTHSCWFLCPKLGMAGQAFVFLSETRVMRAS